VKDSNGNPTLLVPNIDSIRTLPRRTFNRVEYDQTASHLHHANDFGIQLPTSFDMEKYMLMKKQDKIQYAKQNVSKETIISYQNAIGMAINPTFGLATRGKKKDQLIKKLTTSDITRRIKYLKFDEKIKNI
jgi:hypothetical protein